MRIRKAKKLDPRRLSRAELAERLSALQRPVSNDAGDSQISDETRVVLHELEVSQIELEVQNRELRESRRAVDESHDKYIDLYDFAPIGYVTLDRCGVIREVNLTGAALLGSERRHLIGRSLAVKLEVFDRRAFRDHLKVCEESEQKMMLELNLNRAGVQIPIQLLSSKTRDRVTGEVLFRTVMTDLTEQKRAENDLKNERNRAEIANRTKTAFLANVSHEIRTPLGAILGFTDLIKTSKSVEERDHFSDVISRNGWALAKLIDDILDLTKVEAGRLQLELIDFNLRHLLKDVLLLFQNPNQNQQVKLKLWIDEKTPEYLNSDPTRIRQILINLIGNAVKFTQRGSVSIRVEPVLKFGSVSCIRFAVKDTGIGLNTEQVAKLFEPFSQADSSTTRKYGGTGLGLALSRRLAQALGGDITVKDFAPGRGCTFLAKVQAVPAKHFPDEAESPSPIANPGNGKRKSKILLIEDSLDNQEYIQNVLHKAGMTVDVANNGVEGMRMANSSHYDIVLMDMQMPLLDGYAATEQLRHDGYDRPIVALTAHAMAEDRRRSFEIGCNAHLTKPLDTKLLMETISRLQT